MCSQLKKNPMYPVHIVLFLFFNLFYLYTTVEKREENKKKTTYIKENVFVFLYASCILNLYTKHKTLY